jgi:inhibitor of cysteine peptidase
MRSAIFLACVPLALLSCSIKGSPDMSDIQTITEADAGSVVEIRTGELLAVCLNENPSTGFRWTLEGEPGLFAVEDNRYSAASENLGSGGQECWYLRAKKPGHETIAFRLWRHWEGDRSVVKRFEFRASVSVPARQ